MPPEPRTRRPGELVFSLVLLAFSLFAAWQAWRISGFSSLSSAGVFPMIATVTMLVSGLFIVAETARAKPEVERGRLQAFAANIAPLRLVAFTLLIVAYMLALQPAGFLLSSFLFLFLGMSFLYRKGVLVNLAVSAGSLMIIYIIFRHVFSVVLPAGRLF
jgi:putative tricarboxylic transport membrane protein